jgi:hypothetical protein
MVLGSANSNFNLNWALFDGGGYRYLGGQKIGEDQIQVWPGIEK